MIHVETCNFEEGSTYVFLSSRDTEGGVAISLLQNRELASSVIMTPRSGSYKRVVPTSQ